MAFGKRSGAPAKKQVDAPAPQAQLAEKAKKPDLTVVESEEAPKPAATAMSLSLLKFVGQGSLVDDAMLPS